jgi:5-hydroxyisourate hydrolase-like protein (transthyretin family)
LRPTARREVVLRFQKPPDAPPIEGSVGIDYTTQRPIRDATSNSVAITDNQARCEVPVPCVLRYGIDFFRGNRPVGYWFRGSDWMDIPPGDGPFTIEVRARPAGAIYGKILRSDGSIPEKARIFLKIVQGPDDVGRRQGHLSLDLTNMVNNSVQRGTFNVTPLPLGGEYAIVAQEDHTFAMSDTFTVDEKTPIIQADLQLPPGVDIQGYLRDAQGVPVRNDVFLDVSLKRGGQSWGMGCVNLQPDETGGFVLKNVNPGPQGTCAIHVIGRKGCRPAKQEIKDLRSPVVIQLEKGLRVTGTVLDDATGRPVPGVEVYAFSVVTSDDRLRDNWELLNADDPTDEQGRFVFTNMAPKRYQLGTRSVNLVGSGQPFVVTGDQSAPVVVRVRIPEGSDLKVREPQDAGRKED